MIFLAMAAMCILICYVMCYLMVKHNPDLQGPEGRQGPQGIKGDKGERGATAEEVVAEMLARAEAAKQCNRTCIGPRCEWAMWCTEQFERNNEDEED